MTVTEALQLIEKNEGLMALNYCIAQAAYAIHLIQCGHMLLTSNNKIIIDGDGSIKGISHNLRIQLLQVLNNMIYWKQCKASTTTAAEIKECRAVLKKASQ